MEQGTETSLVPDLLIACHAFDRSRPLKYVVATVRPQDLAHRLVSIAEACECVLRTDVATRLALSVANIGQDSRKSNRVTTALWAEKRNWDCDARTRILLSITRQHTQMRAV